MLTLNEQELLAYPGGLLAVRSYHASNAKTRADSKLGKRKCDDDPGQRRREANLTHVCKQLSSATMLSNREQIDVSGRKLNYQSFPTPSVTTIKYWLARLGLN